uniref:Phosphate transport regulator related to PhoU n=1 Tax=Desulfovibrio sp. U5L TaxID=596152 RepID=I2Q688_9BACT
MGFSLFPRSAKFYDLFKEQHRKLVKAAGILDELFTTFDDVEERCKRINIIESEGNAISRRIAKELSLTFITPIDREDIHQINLTQEDILNLVKAIASRIGLFGFDRIRYPARRIIANMRVMIEELGVVLGRMSQNKQAEESFHKIENLKHECETLLMVGIGELYDGGEVNADYAVILDIVKWKHIFDRIEAAVDRTESLADVLEGVVLKNA